ncbi:MAG TPA: IclR family transcriptional regulator [Pseudonocardia sp.]|uniref:IclR family transcriptional regulator n=1 Tax=Pseudonocardia sp. TaxID=60912 RepID=UPI002F42153E
MTVRSPMTAETSVGRAFRVVEAVADAGDGVTPKAIARRLGFTLPTTYRLLSMLVEEGYLVRLRELRGYGLGYRLGELAHRLTDQLAVPWAVRGVVHDLHRLAGGPAYYAVFRDDQIVIAHLDDCPVHPGPAPLRVGEPVVGHATSVGKVLLADLDRRRLAGLLSSPDPLTRMTQRTITDRGRLGRELELVRELGVAAEVDELVVGQAGVAAPVRTHSGEVIGALGVSVSRPEFTARRTAIERLVRDAARRVGDSPAEQVAAG